MRIEADVLKLSNRILADVSEQSAIDSSQKMIIAIDSDDSLSSSIQANFDLREQA